MHSGCKLNFTGESLFGRVLKWPSCLHITFANIHCQTTRCTASSQSLEPCDDYMSVQRMSGPRHCMTRQHLQSTTYAYGSIAPNWRLTYSSIMRPCQTSLNALILHQQTMPRPARRDKGENDTDTAYCYLVHHPSLWASDLTSRLQSS